MSLRYLKNRFLASIYLLSSLEEGLPVASINSDEMRMYLLKKSSSKLSYMYDRLYIHSRLTLLVFVFAL